MVGQRPLRGRDERACRAWPGRGREGVRLAVVEGDGVRHNTRLLRLRPGKEHECASAVRTRKYSYGVSRLLASGSVESSAMRSRWALAAGRSRSRTRACAAASVLMTMGAPTPATATHADQATSRASSMISEVTPAPLRGRRRASVLARRASRQPDLMHGGGEIRPAPSTSRFVGRLLTMDVSATETVSQ